MSEEGVLQSLEAQNELTQLSKCLDPAFKLFGRTIPVHSASETSEKSSESNDSCEVENFSLEKSSSNSSFCLEEVSVKEMSSDDYKSSVCVQKCSEENVCSDDGRPSLGFEEKFQTETFNDEKTKFGIDKINLKKNLDGIKKIHEKKINDGKLAVYEEQYVKDEESLLKKKYLNDEKSTCVEGQKIKKKDLNDKKSSIGAETNGIKDGLEEINRNEDGVPKKPNKLLPCPRCESMDTKFCYYNNYNVNQPRHFCRNCQRYWTAGGLLRNVPVGAGRRKNKHSAINYQRNLVGENRQLMGHGQDYTCGNPESTKFEVSDLERAGFGQVFHDVKSELKGSEAFVSLESCALLSQENENVQKPSCSSNQIGCEKGENFWEPGCSSEQCSYEKEGESGEFQTLDDSVCASSVTNSKFLKLEVKENCESNNSHRDGGASFEMPSNADAGSWANSPSPIWPLYYGSFYGNAPCMNGIGGGALMPEAVQTNAMMPWFQPGAGLCPVFPWPFPSGPVWGQAGWGPAWGMPLSPVAPASANADSFPSKLGKHTRDSAALQSGVELVCINES